MNIQKDRTIERLFKENRAEIADEGFSSDLCDKLPSRPSIRPYLFTLALLCLIAAALCFIVSSASIAEWKLDWSLITSWFGQISVRELAVILCSLTISGSLCYALYVCTDPRA